MFKNTLTVGSILAPFRLFVCFEHYRTASESYFLDIDTTVDGLGRVKSHDWGLRLPAMSVNTRRNSYMDPPGQSLFSLHAFFMHLFYY